MDSGHTEHESPKGTAETLGITAEEAQGAHGLIPADTGLLPGTWRYLQSVTIVTLPH